MLDRHPQRHSAAKREAHNHRALQTKTLDQGGNVVRHRLESHLTISGWGPAMRLEVDADDLAAGGQELHVGAEHLDRAETAMQQD